MSKPKKVLAQAAIIVSVADTRTSIELLTKRQVSETSISLMLWNRNRTELIREYDPTIVVLNRVSTEAPPSMMRPVEALGGDGIAFGKTEFDLSQATESWGSMGIEVILRSDCESAVLYVERPKRNWGMASVQPRPKYAFLLTGQQIAERIGLIACRHGFANARDEVRVNALSSAYGDMLGGYDSPLIEEEFDENE